MKTAIVYCEKQFGQVDGKTANGLIRHSEQYKIVGVLDSALAGQDAGEALGEQKKNIPIFSTLDDALKHLPDTPDCYIYGKAPLEASILPKERRLILAAIENGMDIINGLHQFFSEDAEFIAAATKYNVQIRDIRKPPQLAELHTFTGAIATVTIPVIAMLGTDCACGKMTTAIELNKALNAAGIHSILVATGQTNLMQGAKYGVSMDALVSQFVIGEIENAVVSAFRQESPDIILVEGQSAVSHPAFMSSLGILKGSMPEGVILQHPPARKMRCDFPNLPMPTVEREIELIEAIASARVLAITLSHEGLSLAEVPAVVERYEKQFQLPTTDVLSNGCQKLVQALAERFPSLQKKIEQKLNKR